MAVSRSEIRRIKRTLFGLGRRRARPSRVFFGCHSGTRIYSRRL